MTTEREEDLESALGDILSQLPKTPNAQSWGYGQDRGRIFYLRKLSPISVEHARRVLRGRHRA